jgi:hypothetical protein
VRRWLRRGFGVLSVGVAAPIGLYAAASFYVTEKVLQDRFTPGTEPYRGVGWCETCHPEHVRQWRTSLHSQATSLDFEPLHLMRTRACYSCHGFEDADEGVSCEICHGPGHTAQTDFGERPLCVRCHADENPLTGTGVMVTVDEWLGSRAHREGQTCTTCHMPPVEHADPPMHFHGFYGNVRHPEIYPGKVRIADLRVEAGSALVSVENTVTGHFMPTGCPSKFIELVVTGEDAGGREVYTERRVFQRQMSRFMSEVRDDTRLRDGERRELAFALPGSLGRVKATLRLYPSDLWAGGRGRIIELDERVAAP